VFVLFPQEELVQMVQEELRVNARNVSERGFAVLYDQDVDAVPSVDRRCEYPPLSSPYGPYKAFV